MSKFRTHICSKISYININEIIKLSGWVNKKRNHGSLLFIELRDHSGIIQIITSNKDPRLNFLNKIDFNLCYNVRNESVISIIGKVISKNDKNINKTIINGKVEIIIKKFFIESNSEILPFSINNDKIYSEDLRLKYRFLDLRRYKLRNNIILRSKVIKFLRDYLSKKDFIEFQTPILTSGSSEGARDFIVPSRLHKNKFYSLPQAPQQFKQLLMISGFDKYFQIAPCFRDEDARADRTTGEFYQLDIELSFIEQKDIFSLVEPIFIELFKKFSSYKLEQNEFPKISYKNAKLNYGTDKPDLRNPIRAYDITKIIKDKNFFFLKNIIKKKIIIKAIPLDKKVSRNFCEKIINYFKNDFFITYIMFGCNNKNISSPILKFLKLKEIINIKKFCFINKENLIFLIFNTTEYIIDNIKKIRDILGKKLNIIEDNSFKFCWVVDYPMYKWNYNKKKLTFFHNPFSLPQIDLENLKSLNTLDEKLSIKAFQYDMICNGIELSSGAIRNHKVEILYNVFKHVGYSKSQVNNCFTAITSALKYGAPPHGGLAYGIDRIIMMLSNSINIKEVIAFPLNKNAQDLMTITPKNIYLSKNYKEK